MPHLDIWQGSSGKNVLAQPGSRVILSAMLLARLVIRGLLAAALIGSPLIHGALAAAQSHQDTSRDTVVFDSGYTAGGVVAHEASHAGACDEGAQASSGKSDEGNGQASTCAACFASHCFPVMLGASALVLPASIAGTGCPSHAATSLLDIRFPSIEPPRA